MLMPPKTAAERLLEQRLQEHQPRTERTTLTVYKNDLARSHRLVERLGPGWNNYKVVAAALEVLEATLNDVEADHKLSAFTGAGEGQQ